MRIVSVSENKKIEKRIAITPEIAKKYIVLGFEITLVEKYGEHLGFKDSDYKELGVEISNKKSEVLNSADIIIQLGLLSDEDLSNLKDNQTFIGVLNPFTNKEDGLKSFMYSIVIENIKENDYFTEKIVDSCLCNTVPIYWGAPNISDYFDIRGMIICDSLDEIMDALKKINSDDYNSRKKWIHKNKLKAISHADYIKRAAEVILKS